MNSPDHNPILDRKTWLRLPVLALFALLACLALSLLLSLALFQWLHRLLAGQVHAGVADFGRHLGEWWRTLAAYLLADRRERPFPFEDDDLPAHPAGHEAPTGTPPAAREKTGRRPRASKRAGPAAGSKKTSRRTRTPDAGRTDPGEEP